MPAWVYVTWQRPTIAYFTDPGPLSAEVNHTQADAMVAAAAAVWNVPTSSVGFAKGGELAEDVNGTNTSFDENGASFPADVQVGNEGAVPLAIVYDADGSLTDLLLGPGASDPDSCATNAVLGDVDDIHQLNAEIAHATLVLNGRCAGAAPEQLTQMQYQLARALGRVLGLSWSQTNDNVFTAENPVTANQLAFWPLMHPLDVICGEYTYQCMPDPFSLRADDLNTLALLYTVYQAAVGPGKQGSADGAMYVRGLLQFPTGQGMAWTNMTTRRNHGGAQEDWQTTSSMTGFEYEQANATPVAATAAVDSGYPNAGLDAFFVLRRVPLDGISDVYIAAEAINPLYMGEAAIGPYVRMPATPSGTVTFFAGSSVPNGDNPGNLYLMPNGAASACGAGADGSEAAPASTDPSGWQRGQLCAQGHNSWWSVPVAAGHSWTFEVTATDETGAASMSKAMPVVGAWQAADATGTLPTVAATPVAFNSLALGMTQVGMDAQGNDAVYRMSVSDQYGAGRPDFTYTARVLYADHVTPAVLGTVGGAITITGTGFVPGMNVTVNGAQATVLTATANQIVALAPSAGSAGAGLGRPVDVVVSDPATAGSASVPAALSYVVLPDTMQLVSAPSGLEDGLTAAVPFAIQVTASDGRTPVQGATVQLSASAGTATLGVCGGQASCTLTTGVNGILTTNVSGLGTGAAVLVATEVAGTASVQVNLQVTAPVRHVALDRTVHYVAAGVADSWLVQLTAEQDGAPAGNAPVSWTSSARLSEGPADGVTTGSGVAALSVSAPALPGSDTETVQACVWGTLCAGLTIHAVDAALWTPVAMPGAAQSVPASESLVSFRLLITDGSGHPLEKAPVQVEQRVLGWEGTCPEAGRCPAAPVLATSQAALVSDGEGLITVTPVQVAGVPQTVEIAVATGTNGFLTLTLVKVP